MIAFNLWFDAMMRGIVSVEVPRAATRSQSLDCLRVVDDGDNDVAVPGTSLRVGTS
jgi:hypothetical protein